LSWLAGEMTLSDKSSANIDWKLNQLLSASRASRSYVTRQVVPVPVSSPGFAPWTPREIGQATVADQLSADRPVADERLKVPAAETSTEDARSAFVPEQKHPAGLPPGAVIMMPAELEQLRSTAFEQGKRQACAENERIAEDNEQRFAELMQTLSAARVDFSSLNASVAELSLFIAKQVVRAEITTNSTWHETLIERCLEEIRRHGNDRITVRVSRMDFDLHHQRFEHRQDLVLFVPDERLQQGDIEVEMGATQISELITAKFALITADMFASLSAAPAGHDGSADVLLLPEDF
jgi:flagellar biosynthesis/type III secretory pathway protein FliH